jgi:hypothetical protein
MRKFLYGLMWFSILSLFTLAIVTSFEILSRVASGILVMMLRLVGLKGFNFYNLVGWWAIVLLVVFAVTSILLIAGQNIREKNCSAGKEEAQVVYDKYDD